jgi:thymidylate synthase
LYKAITGFKVATASGYNSNSGYSSHILNTGHTYDTITDTMKIITGRKGKYLNTLGKYYIYNVSKKNLHMNDTDIDTYNPIFEELHKITL